MEKLCQTVCYISFLKMDDNVLNALLDVLLPLLFLIVLKPVFLSLLAVHSVPHFRKHLV